MDCDQPVGLDVGDGEPDHVEVGDEREQRAPRPPADDEIPDRVALDLSHVADRVTDDVEGQLLLPGGAVREQQRVEELRDGHLAGSLWP